MAGQINESAKAAYDALAAEYRQAHADLAVSRASRAAQELARQHLSIARRIFRIAAFQAPAEGEECANFDASLASIRTTLATAREQITT